MRYLHDWCQLSKSIDIATGYFEIGSLLALEDEWKKVDSIRIPRPDHSAPRENGALPWTEEAGEARWLLYDLAREAIIEEPTEIIEAIRCRPDTPRQCRIEQPTLAEIRAKLDKHIKNTRLKQLQAPVGVKPLLKAWMELN
jgi:hypothetical protein